MSDTVQRIKEKLSIADVVSQYVKLERSGANMRARCPFHSERSPSFFVSPERGTYHCFGCGAGGDIFSFVEAIEGIDFKGALKILAERAGVELTYEKGSGKDERDERDRLLSILETATLFYASRLPEDARAYLHKRGLTDTTIASFRIGCAGADWSALSDHLKTKRYAEQDIVNAGVAKRNERGGLTDKFRNRIIFPINDSAGRAVAFSGRIFGAEAHPDAPKYLNSPETALFHKSRILYGFDRAKQSMRKHNCAVLVEGQVDLVMSHQAGWTNTVAVSGTAFTPEHAALIHRMTENLVIALDADQAGIKAAARAARAALASELNVKVARLPQGLDPADLILKEGADAWSEAIRAAEDIISFLLGVLKEHVPQQERFRRAVRESVLPFLVEVREPIKRDQYVRLVAASLGVPESSITEALSLMRSDVVPAQRDAFTRIPSPDRIKQAYGVYVWQKSLGKPALDPEAFYGALREAAGEEISNTLATCSPEETEALRFAAERLYGEREDVRQQMDILLKVLEREQLSRKLHALMGDLKLAEARGDEAEIGRLLQSTQAVTVQIARLSS